MAKPFLTHARVSRPCRNGGEVETDTAHRLSKEELGPRVGVEWSAIAPARVLEKRNFLTLTVQAEVDFSVSGFSQPLFDLYSRHAIESLIFIPDRNIPHGYNKVHKKSTTRSRVPRATHADWNIGVSEGKSAKQRRSERDL